VPFRQFSITSAGIRQPTCIFMKSYNMVSID
jgi:hypothetical protein